MTQFKELTHSRVGVDLEHLWDVSHKGEGFLGNKNLWKRALPTSFPGAPWRRCLSGTET